MKFMTNLLMILVALFHIAFLVMEMFLWTTPQVAANFDLTVEQAQLMAPLAANMGLYNGFLAIGLPWAWFAKRADVSISRFFLICMIIAGIYGAATVKPSILWVQALPAAIALLLIALNPSSEPLDQSASKSM